MQSPTIGAVRAGEKRINVFRCARSCSQARASLRRIRQDSSIVRSCNHARSRTTRICLGSWSCEILLSSRHEEEKKSSGLFDTADDADGGVEGNYWFLILHPGSYPVTDPRNKTLKNYRCFCILSCIRSTNCLMLAIFFVRSKRFSWVIPWYS